MKHISSLYGENFQGFDTLKINDLANVNVPVDINDTGRTSALEAIFVFSGMSNTLIPLDINTMKINDISKKSRLCSPVPRINATM